MHPVSHGWRGALAPGSSELEDGSEGPDVLDVVVLCCNEHWAKGAHREDVLNDSGRSWSLVRRAGLEDIASLQDLLQREGHLFGSAGGVVTRDDFAAWTEEREDPCLFTLIRPHRLTFEVRGKAGSRNYRARFSFSDERYEVPIADTRLLNTLAAYYPGVYQCEDLNLREPAVLLTIALDQHRTPKGVHQKYVAGLADLSGAMDLAEYERLYGDRRSEILRTHPRTYEPWSEDEDHSVRFLDGLGYSPDEIGFVLRRYSVVVRGRMNTLRLR